ncbi:MAG TPA: hypothetical protein VFO82_13795 [Steroidobacteraceae bacterium]|nr:hypothetical protein [Steroidobacteraceae bacterium]
MQAAQSGSRFAFAAFATLLFVGMARADEPRSGKDEFITSRHSASLEWALDRPWSFGFRSRHPPMKLVA